MIEHKMRELVEADFDAQAELVRLAFLSLDGVGVLRERLALQLAGTRTVGVFDGERLVGVTSVGQRELTLPEATVVPFASVTYVAVAPDHRRRGVLSSLMRKQLHGVHETGGPAIAALWASEAAIYQRFGFGPATATTRYEVPARAAFRAGVDLGEDRVKELPGAEAIGQAKSLYAAYAAVRAGALSRDEAQWSEWEKDLESLRRGRSALRWGMHPQGYVLFRHKPGYNDRGANGTVDVEELVALTPQAHAAVLRYVLDTDLAATIHYESSPDDPLPLMLQDSRAAVGKVFDALYIRLVDVDRALAQRRYRAPVDVVIEVTDDVCPWNAGRVRLVVDEKGVPTVTRTSDPADLSAGVVDLGAAYLGGTRLSRLADAGRVVEHTPGAVSALTTALLSDREPRTLEVF